MKIKPLTKEQIITSIDRLTRFKYPEIKYLRVFKDIITGNLIEPKYKKSDLDKIDYKTIKFYAENIINDSLYKITTTKSDNKYIINKKLLNYEERTFNIDENTKILLDNKINYSAFLDILPDKLPANLIFLKSLLTDAKETSVFPVKKIILCEGITEEILLPEFAKLYGYDFNRHGIYIISAGGKNQVVKYYYNYINHLKIPVFILLDNDAFENLEQIKPKLRKIDKIHILKSGEFEDLLPNSLIIKTLKYTTKNISEISHEGLKNTISKVEFLEEFYKHRGLHEFKKSEFALAVKANIYDNSDISEEIKEIFEELKF